MAKHHKYEMTKILLDVSRVVSSSLDLDEVADLVLKESIKALGADHASLFLLDDNFGYLTLARAIGFTKDKMDNIKLLGSWEVINNQLVKKKEPLIVNDIHRSPLFKKKKLPFSREKLPVESFLAVPLEKDDKVIGALIVSNMKRPGYIFTGEDKKLLVALSNHISIALLNAKLYKNLKNLFISTIKSLVRAIEAKDPYTSGHSERVMRYAVAIGKEIGLDDDKLENLRLSSLLHDVGKIGIKDRVLTKHGKLAKNERDQIIQHTTIGVKIVEGMNGAEKILKGIKEHHERFDGSGYPGHLKGKQISLEGRIIAVADVFDALTTNRPYQKGCSAREAIFEIINNSSSQFDPKVVKAFLKSFSKHHDVWKA